MANRPVFECKQEQPYYIQLNVDFVWVRGMSAQQRKKCALSLHDAYQKHYPDRKVLEVSSKSTVPLGVAASAFNLKKFVPSLGKSLPVEVIYQAAKVFENGGPYLDLYNGTSRVAKKDDRLKTSGEIIAFRYEGRDYPAKPLNAFYNWLYINALLENEGMLDVLRDHDAFTDIEFNPSKGMACQARAVAVALSLQEMGLLDKVKEFDDFVALMGATCK